MKKNNELGKNATIFRDHICAGMDYAGLNPDDYAMSIYRNDENGEIGLLLAQVPISEVESEDHSLKSSFAIVCWEDQITYHFEENSASLPISKKQPASILASMFLGAIVKGTPVPPLTNLGKKQIIRNYLRYQVTDILHIKDKVGTGTTASIEGFDALATVVSGGELGLKVVELNEDHLSLIWYLITHALIERGEEVDPSHYSSDFQLKHIETPHLLELLEKLDDIDW